MKKTARRVTGCSKRHMQIGADNFLADIVGAAFLRSLGAVPRLIPFTGGLIALIGDDSAMPGSFAFRGKGLVFGKPPKALLPALGLAHDKGLADLIGQDCCAPAQGDTPFSESPAFLRYAGHDLANSLALCMRCRPFTRFDYADEWNNLGFGRIRTDASVWSACNGYVPDKAQEIAGIFVRKGEGEAYCGSYLSLFDTAEASILWCARPAGPVDSTEWAVVERFISDWRAESMPCLPVLQQTPQGCRCLVTMRLDCDEDLSSARGLFEWYKSRDIPFSLAVKTNLPLKAADLALLEDVRAAGGSLLSHSHTHQFNWGASPNEALSEAGTSRRFFSTIQPEAKAVDLAVSPFHSNPPYAVRALAQAGYSGFVGGIIHNDPEYLLGRAGIVPFANGRLVSISQQSMLHGDSYQRQGQGVTVHIEAFEAQYAVCGIFGFLDHPFSERYQYGWQNEEQRLKAHQKLIAAMAARPGVLFWSQQRCFDFIGLLAAVRLCVAANGDLLVLSGAAAGVGIMVRYKGRDLPLDSLAALE
ncbi:hypothetical protein LJC09_02530 [Desulfovibrio sp. OttesenSCG-928-F20]|nr:hypothetical protein [Desulfovibrio sp. OttesenSCG-928-F20]